MFLRDNLLLYWCCCVGGSFKGRRIKVCSFLVCSVCVVVFVVAFCILMAFLMCLDIAPLYKLPALDSSA